jgi:hypothetical protein
LEESDANVVVTHAFELDQAQHDAIVAQERFDADHEAGLRYDGNLLAQEKVTNHENSDEKRIN